MNLDLDPGRLLEAGDQGVHRLLVLRIVKDQSCCPGATVRRGKERQHPNACQRRGGGTGMVGDASEAPGATVPEVHRKRSP